MCMCVVVVCSLSLALSLSLSHMWVSLDPPFRMSWVSRLWFCCRVLHDPHNWLFVVARALALMELSHDLAHMVFSFFFSVRVCSLTWKVVVMICGRADRSAMQRF